MGVRGLIFVAAVLAAAPVALAQTEAPPPAATAAEGYVAIEPADDSELTAPAQTPAAEAAAVEQAVEAAAEEPALVCRTVIARTESRLRSARERVCRTQAQWDEIDARSARQNNRSPGPDNN